MNLKKTIISILVLLISTLTYAQEIKGSDILEKLSGKTLKNYPIKSVKGYVSKKGKLILKVIQNGSSKKFKGTITSADTNNIKWTKGNSGSSTLTLVKVDSDNWKLQDSNGWETPSFYIKDGNYFNY